MGKDEELHRKLDLILAKLEKFGPILEAIDLRFALQEDAAEVIARDVSQARHNTHELNNKLQKQFTLTTSSLQVLSRHFSEIDVPVDKDPTKEEP